MALRAKNRAIRSNLFACGKKDFRYYPWRSRNDGQRNCICFAYTIPLCASFIQDSLKTESTVY
ncbi:MAG: hypothetical protein LBK44_03040 [Spirochaetales bacterium]|nr:hypothetical protein [Spirochaetales bacterium]